MKKILSGLSVRRANEPGVESWPLWPVVPEFNYCKQIAPSARFNLFPSRYRIRATSGVVRNAIIKLSLTLRTETSRRRTYHFDVALTSGVTPPLPVNMGDLAPVSPKAVVQCAIYMPMSSS